MNAKQEEEALFWCGLLTPVLFGELDKGEVCQKLRELSEIEVVFPSGSKRRPSLSTLKRKYKKYHEHGFNGMGRKARADRGKPRAVSSEVIATAIEVKKDQPRRSPIMINEVLEQMHGTRMARSSMYRHLKDAGATRVKLGVTAKKVRKRWTSEHSNDMWAGDFEYGPYVLLNGKSVQSYLSAFIDVRSRYIVAARYYVRQNFDVLTDTMVRGFDVHGVPRYVYVDNGKVYHAGVLKKVCYRLGIGLLHRPVRDPAPGGIIERFFETAQSQFEAEVRMGDMFTLDRLNEGFAAWLNVIYHQTINTDTGQTPNVRYKECLIALRQADMEAVVESFLQQEERTVNKTFSDIRLKNAFYKVDPKLRSDRVSVRYDQRGAINEVLIYSLKNEYLGKGLLHHREQGQEVPVEAPKSSVRFNVLDIIIAKHKAKCADVSNQINYSDQQKSRRWSFDSFVACMADLLGLKAGISSFSNEEIAVLNQIFNQHPHLTRTLLKKAFAQAQYASIPSVMHALQQIQPPPSSNQNKEN